ncbi:MAG: pyridoxal-phosphate-dependent aminotransferase family protein [Bacillota bacterium]
MLDNIVHRNPGERILLGPGPSNADPRVLRAMAAPVLGHLDPEFLEIMTETMELLRFVFETRNQLTLPMSGTGSSGMETALVNMLEPGDDAVVCVHGLFGERLADAAKRCGANVTVVSAPWGHPIDPDDVRKVLRSQPAAKLLAVVHAETSTGVLQPLEEISSMAREYDMLLVVDTVTSLGGIPVRVDERGLDVVFSGTQKCLSCPPGLAPITLNERAVQVLRERKTKVQSWYLDLSMIQQYWGKERFYHHTAPINMIYALHEALLIIKEEGLEQRFRRHAKNSAALTAGLEAMGLKMLVEQPGYRLPSLHSVLIPDGIADLDVRRRLLSEYSIEIGGGLGNLKGRIWRIGLMGSSSTKKHVVTLLSALENVLVSLKAPVTAGQALRACEDVYAASEAS